MIHLMFIGCALLFVCVVILYIDNQKLQKRLNEGQIALLASRKLVEHLTSFQAIDDKNLDEYHAAKKTPSKPFAITWRY